jgi:hypothetical protein
VQLPLHSAMAAKREFSGDKALNRIISTGVKDGFDEAGVILDRKEGEAK